MPSARGIGGLLPHHGRLLARQGCLRHSSPITSCIGIGGCELSDPRLVRQSSMPFDSDIGASIEAIAGVVVTRRCLERTAPMPLTYSNLPSADVIDPCKGRDRCLRR